MRTVPAWIDRVHDTNKTEQCIYDLCFNPDGTHLIVAAGQVVSVYDCSNGSVIQTLKGHKDTVYCVAYSQDGARFGSGGADKAVIIWTSKLEPLLKYTQNDAIQCLEFNPVTHVLASCASSDFYFWSIEQKSVQKYKTPARVNSCSWNSVGQYLALGLANGNVSIRNANGDEKFFLERDTSEGPVSPIWALKFSPRREDSDILCVTDWSQRMTFYSLENEDIGKEQIIGFEALSANYMPKGNYILVGGCNKQCILMSNEGIKLGIIGEEQQSWVWSCKANPVAPFVVVGCQDGTLAYFQLTFNIVHHLYGERYAFRENMTDVIVQHLLTDERVRIKCRHPINKIAIFKDRLAVLLPTKVVVYELSSKEADEMRYQIKTKIIGSFDCNILVVCTEHLVFCQGARLRCLKFDGKNVGQWLMDTDVRHIKVVGGAPGNEGLIVGLGNGQISKLNLNNPFAMPVLKTSSAILCVDLSISKRKIAVVNEDQQCVVFDLVQNKILYQEAKATGVAWNAMYDDMLCFSGNGVLNIKIERCQPHQMRFEGLVVAVFGSKAYSLNGSNIIAVDIPLSTPMFLCLEKQMYRAAFEVARLGVPEKDWKSLAHAALEGSEYHIAMDAFVRVKDLQHLELIHEFLEKNEENRESFFGDLLAYDGRFKEAAKMYQKAGESHKAVSMYSDMRMFDLAQDFVKLENSTDKKSLIRKKAEWAKNVNEPKAAAEIYLAAGDVSKAVDIAIENQWLDMLVDLARKLDRIEVESLRRIASCFCQHGDVENAIDVYNKLGDNENILRLYVEAKNWQSAFALVKKHPRFEAALYMPYAQWLVENDKFVEAQKAFHKAGKPEEATKVLQVLIENAVDESRFDDAGYYHWILSRQYLELARIMDHRKEDLIRNFERHDNLANIYYAYHSIQIYVEEPFSTLLPEGIFGIARYLSNETKNVRPDGVVQFPILHSLAKQARNLGGFKIARQALDAMQNLLIPAQFQDFVDLTTVMMKAKPFHDNEELLIMCYRCSWNNPLVMSGPVSTPGNRCLNCKQPFVFSFYAFDVLPLVEFLLEDGISDDEAMQLLLSSNDVYERRTSTEDSDAAFQTLLIEDASQTPADLFTSTLINLENDGSKYSPVVVNRETLLSMDSSLVLVCRWPKPLRYRFYKNLLPDVQMIACPSCFKTFHIDNYDLEVLKKGYCPFCRVVPEDDSKNEDKFYEREIL